MIWLLDLAERHRAALQYDLLKHGRRLDDLGTDRLWWDEAFVIVTQQPAEGSAVHRAEFPEEHDRTKLVDRVETLVLLFERDRQRRAGVPEGDLPGMWSDLFAPAEPEGMSLEEIDRRLGRTAMIDSEPRELMTPEEIDERMGRWQEQSS